jgi:hypothetical protein
MTFKEISDIVVQISYDIIIVSTAVFIVCGLVIVVKILWKEND